MSTSVTHPAAPPRRRMVLVDFGWADADLVPELLRLPEVQVRLMAGCSERDPGIRVADLCGVPHTLDLDDLARESFDVALVGPGSSRRSRIDQLLRASGTVVLDPREFLSEARWRERRDPSQPEAGAELTSLDDTELASWVDSAIPDLTPEGEESPWPDGPIPAPGDESALRALLARAAERSNASAWSLRARDAEADKVLAVQGSEDPLLTALAEQCFGSREPEVVRRISGSTAGTWGAWPLRIGARPAVLLAAGFEADAGARVWERLALALTAAWSDRFPEDRGASAPSLGPWHSAGEWHTRLEQAIERNRRDGQPFVIHRLRADARPGLVESMWRQLALDVRLGDALCRVGPDALLVLSPGPASAFARVIDRLGEHSERWSREDPIEPPTWSCERVELASREDAPLFRAIAEGWLRST